MNNNYNLTLTMTFIIKKMTISYSAAVMGLCLKILFQFHFDFYEAFICIISNVGCYLLFRVIIANDFVTLSMTFLLKISILKNCFCNTSMFQEKKISHANNFMLILLEIRQT